MSVREEVEVALKELLLPELAEIKKSLTDLKASLGAVMKSVKEVGRPMDDFDHIRDMQAAGASHEQAVAIVRAKHEISQAAKADLEEVGLKVEGDFQAVGLNLKLSQAIVRVMKDVRREDLEKLAARV